MPTTAGSKTVCAVSPCPSIQSLVVVRGSNSLGREGGSREQWGPGLGSERTTLRAASTQNPSEFFLKKSVAYTFACLSIPVTLLL